jgi:uncharacterized membrane protein
LVIISSLSVPRAFSQETEDSQVFIAGFNAFQRKDYASSIEKMNEVLQKFPDTPLRDVSLFWLSRSYYKAGNHQEAARLLSQFSKEYPDNPLKSTVEDELLTLVTRYENGEKLPVGSPPVKQAENLVAQKAKLEKERIAAAKAEEARQAAAAAETARIATLKQAEDNAAAEQKERERIAAVATEREQVARETAAKELAEQQRIAARKAEESRQAAAATEAARVAALRQAEENAAAEQKERERVAAVAAEREQVARETAAKELAEQQRIAARKAEDALKAEVAAEADRLSRQKAELQRRAEQQAEQERAAQAEAELARMNALNAEKERVAAAERVAREQAAQVAAEKERQAVATAEQARLAALKAEAEHNAAEAVAKETAARRRAAEAAEEARLAAAQKRAEETAMATKRAYREKAISEYKAILDKFPGSAAAATAAAKLRELGVAVAVPVQAAAAALPENAQVFNLEVAQFAGFEFDLLPHAGTYAVGQPQAVPFEVTNRGNGTDSFYLESAFPTEFKASFASATAPGVAISQTPELAANETFKGFVTLTIPPNSIDGLRSTHTIKAASRLLAEASQSREIRLIASAPLLRAVVRTEKNKYLPGDRVAYRIAVLNVGSSTAQDVTLRLNFPPQLEPVDYTTAGFRQESKSALAVDGLQLKSGESRELTVVFQLKDDSLAGQELSTRAELLNTQLKTSAAFVSNISAVEPQRNLLVRATSPRMVVIPGQTITVPFVVTNTGNVREKLKVSSMVTGGGDVIVFNDLNRDGIRQSNEPIVNEVGPLAPREEANVAVEMKTPLSATDGSNASIQLSFASEGDASRSASQSTQLAYSRPVLKMVTASKDGRLKPGDVASFDLTITNSGSNLAKVVELQSVWPRQLELIAADPATNSVNNGTVIWRFKELGSTEKRVIKVSFRVKPGTGVGTALQVKYTLNYEDQLGNRY